VRYLRRLPLGHDHHFELWKLKSAESEAGPPAYGDLADNWADPTGTLIRHPRTALVQSLIEFQGHLCAWTGQKIDLDSAHIDHVVPQSVDPSLDLEVNNLVAAFPKSGADAKFGAHVRGDTWDLEMVRPNMADCEERLVYAPSGKVRARVATDDGAILTITSLKLDHRVLIEARNAAIQGFKARRSFVADLAELQRRSKSNKPGKLDRFAPAILSALT
jgi:uncharacterized protein (TIGR02646 family)